MENIRIRVTFAAPSRFMATGKASTLPFRIEPALKEAHGMAGDREQTSTANMVELLIRKHCARNEIRIPEQARLFRGDDTSSYSR